MADEENTEPKKRGPMLRILAFALGGLLLIAAGLGGGYLLFGSSQPNPSEEIESIIEKKIKILPRIKEIQQWTKKRLDMNNEEGQQLMENYKKKIRSIKQH